MEDESYEPKDWKRQRIDAALRSRKDTLSPGRMDDLEDFHLAEAIRQSIEDEDEQAQQDADENLLLTSRRVDSVLQKNIMGFLTFDDLLSLSATTTTLNQAVESLTANQLKKNLTSISSRVSLKRSVEKLVKKLRAKGVVTDRRKLPYRIKLILAKRVKAGENTSNGEDTSSGEDTSNGHFESSDEDTS